MCTWVCSQLRACFSYNFSSWVLRKGSLFDSHGIQTHNLVPVGTLFVASVRPRLAWNGAASRSCCTVDVALLMVKSRLER